MGLGRGLLRRQSRFLRPQLRHVGGDGVGGLGRLALAALQAGQLLADSGQVLFIDLDLGLLGRQALAVAAVPAVEAVPLLLGGGLRLCDGAQHDLELLFLALEPKDLVLRLPELIPGGGELILHLVI